MRGEVRSPANRDGERGAANTGFCSCGISTLNAENTGATPIPFTLIPSFVFGNSFFISLRVSSPPALFTFIPFTGTLLAEVGVDFNGALLQKFLSSLNFLVSGDMNGFIPSNLLVQSSMLIFSLGLVGETFVGEELKLRRENADAKRRSSTGGGVFGTSFDLVGGVVAEDWV